MDLIAPVLFIVALWFLVRIFIKKNTHNKNVQYFPKATIEDTINLESEDAIDDKSHEDAHNAAYDQARVDAAKKLYKEVHFLENEDVVISKLVEVSKISTSSWDAEKMLRELFPEGSVSWQLYENELQRDAEVYKEEELDDLSDKDVLNYLKVKELRKIYRDAIKQRKSAGQKKADIVQSILRDVDSDLVKELVDKYKHDEFEHALKVSHKHFIGSLHHRYNMHMRYETSVNEFNDCKTRYKSVFCRYDHHTRGGCSEDRQGCKKNHKDSFEFGSKEWNALNFPCENTDCACGIVFDYDRTKKVADNWK